MGRGDTSPAPELAVEMEELPRGRPDTPQSPLLDTPGSQQTAAPEQSAGPGEEAPGSRRQESLLLRVKHWIQKYAVPIAAVICLLMGGGIGFISSGAFRETSCPPVPPVPPSCPNKWMRSDGQCYFVSQEKMDWNSSLEFCESHGGTLLPPGNEMLEIGSLHNLANHDYWIDLKKDTDSGEWKQLNGSVWPGPIGYDNFKITCSCVESGKYVALDCSTSRRWICVKSL
ncbi:killer cell lectin-like receptor subfamily G member 1 isoform X2 [Phyllobates terribilis]|uniref:killer cell lectin-like receptor subfamily G member 1 isoform X2 n=1 Tax=Phyllobates terribilis TaxID=111132 RepID=UPI003CCA7ED6